MTIRERAAEFSRVREGKELRAGSHIWRYSLAGQGETVLLLPGGAGIGIGWLDLVLALYPRYRTIAVDYPTTASSFDELADGVLAVLGAENVQRMHVVGQSAGGMLAEVLSRRIPDRIRTMALSGAGLYGSEDVPRLERKLVAIQSAPWEETRTATAKALRAAWQDAEEADFWIEQVDAAYRADGALGLINSYRALIGIARRSEQLMRERPRQGPVLLLKADDDPLITEAHTQRLIGMHPGCEIRTFPTGGHSLLIGRTQDYIAAVAEFLAQHGEPATWR
ncbi:alpha/beta fold hydrolase [Kibdelosporangium aridum]|uniref:alpha/beta fold hydrolase n=1 Tax=Kibdelosporangium aridum TaxID=2030 RepID=UPI000B14AE86